MLLYTSIEFRENNSVAPERRGLWSLREKIPPMKCIVSLSNNLYVAYRIFLEKQSNCWRCKHYKRMIRDPRKCVIFFYRFINFDKTPRLTQKNSFKNSNCAASKYPKFSSGSVWKSHGACGALNPSKIVRTTDK